MRIILTIIACIGLFLSYVFWDYYRTDTFLWGENFLDALFFIIFFFVVSWLFSSTNKTKNDKNT